MAKAFGKKCFLLGKKDGVFYWLEEAKWECDWYWGLGYVETYTNNKNPEYSKDIASHSHFDSMFFSGKNDGYTEFTNFFDATTLTKKETWLLLEYMKSLYTLRSYSDMLKRGSAYYTENPLKDLIKNEQEYDRINKKVIPEILNKVYELLGEK